MGTSSPGAETADTDLPPDVVADLLTEKRRRRALAVLAESSGAVAVGDLAAAVVADDRDPAALDDEERRRARLRFFQRHLPTLTATGVVEYDPVLGRIGVGDDAVVRAARADEDTPDRATGDPTTDPATDDSTTDEER